MLAGDPPRSRETPGAASASVPAARRAGAHGATVHDGFHWRSRLWQEAAGPAPRGRLCDHMPDRPRAACPVRSQAAGGPRPWLRARAREDDVRASRAPRGSRSSSRDLLLRRSTQRTSSRGSAASPGRSFCGQHAPYSTTPPLSQDGSLAGPCDRNRFRSCSSADAGTMGKWRRCTTTRPGAHSSP